MEKKIDQVIGALKEEISLLDLSILDEIEGQTDPTRLALYYGRQRAYAHALELVMEALR